MGMDQLWIVLIDVNPALHIIKLMFSHDPPFERVKYVITTFIFSSCFLVIL